MLYAVMLSICLSVCSFVCRLCRGRSPWMSHVSYPGKTTRDVYGCGGGLLVESKDAPHFTLWTPKAYYSAISNNLPSWYSGRWWVGCYIWYSEERRKQVAAPRPDPPRCAKCNSPPINGQCMMLYDCPSLCGFNLAIIGLTVCLCVRFPVLLQLHTDWLWRL